MSAALYGYIVFAIVTRNIPFFLKFVSSQIKTYNITDYPIQLRQLRTHDELAALHKASVFLSSMFLRP